MKLGDSIRNWFWRGAEPHFEGFHGVGEKLEAELGELKKLLRRQGIQQESLVREVSSKIDAQAGETQSCQALTPGNLADLADSFFHLEVSLIRLGAGPETQAALKIVWEKLQNVCDEAGLELIRESGVPFDSRVHEALNRAPAEDNPFVGEVMSPGFIHNGRVIRPARVVLADDINVA
jgi:hypothetical protein